MNRLAERLIRMGFDPSDFVVVDDGERAWIDEWNSDRPRPSVEDLEAVILPAEPVPLAILRRQLARVLAHDGVISGADAVAWAARGDLPAELRAVLPMIPEDGGQRLDVEMLLSSASEFHRAHPFVPVLGHLLVNPATLGPYDAAALDDLWIRGAAFP